MASGSFIQAAWLDCKQDQLKIRLRLRPDRQPAKPALNCHIQAHLEAQLIGVEIKRLVLIEHIDRCVRQLLDHPILL